MRPIPFIIFPWGLCWILTMLSSWTLRTLFSSVKLQLYVFDQSKGYEALCNSSETFSPRHKQPLNMTDQVGIIVSVICNTANNFFQNHWLVEGPKRSLTDGEAKVDFSPRHKKLFYLWEQNMRKRTVARVKRTHAYWIRYWKVSGALHRPNGVLLISARLITLTSTLIIPDIKKNIIQ